MHPLQIQARVQKVFLLGIVSALTSQLGGASGNITFIAGHGPDFQDQPKLAAESVNQHL